MNLYLKIHRMHYVSCDFVRQWDRPMPADATWLPTAQPPMSVAKTHFAGFASEVFLPPGWELLICLLSELPFYIRTFDSHRQPTRPGENAAVLPGKIVTSYWL